jgi:hypothetical protein
LYIYAFVANLQIYTSRCRISHLVIHVSLKDFPSSKVPPSLNKDVKIARQTHTLISSPHKDPFGHSSKSPNKNPRFRTLKRSMAENPMFGSIFFFFFTIFSASLSLKLTVKTLSLTIYSLSLGVVRGEGAGRREREEKKERREKERKRKKREREAWVYLGRERMDRERRRPIREKKRE